MALLHIEGARIAYDEYGRGTKGARIVFLHACALSRQMWEPQVEALRGSHHVVVPDMRGHGASDVPSFVTSIARMAEDVRALVASLDLAPAVLVGHSMGGHVALQFARAYPADTRGLVLLHTRTRPDGEEAVAERYRFVETLRASGPATLANQMLLRLQSAEASADHPEVAAAARRMIETTSAAGIASAFAALASRPGWDAALPDILAPTLVVAGGADRTAADDARATADAIRGARLSIVEGAGALINLEQPEAFLGVLKPFLDGLPAAGAESGAQVPAEVVPGFATA